MGLVERDLAVLWHPATHFSDQARLPPLPVASARGSQLVLDDGRTILDGISSWWTCLHGHGHPAIAAAITEQVGRLDHIMLAGFTHGPAVELAEALLERAGPGYGRVFYADCGSAAIEVALKLSFQSRLQSGEPKRGRFAALRNSYHGETLGALAVSGSDAYRGMFSPLLPEVTYLPAPAHASHQHTDLEGSLGADSPQADAAVALLERHAEELTALVLEPLVQCAGKMAMYGAGYLRRVCDTAQALGIHVIADEIAVAFGRTGRLFASDWAGVHADLVCLSKGLSGGVLPLSAVLVRAGFEDAFSADPAHTFLHSHTFTGNPIACAAGVASLKLLGDGTLASLPGQAQRLTGAARRVAARLGDRLQSWRQAGMIVAFDVDAARTVATCPDGRVGLALREAALERGVLLRPLHDTLYWMPPYCLSDAEVEQLATVTSEVVEAVTQ